MKQESYRGWAVVIAVGCLMWLLNVWTPLHRDDYEYALIWGTTTPIAGWSDVWHSLYLHYFQHGGRMVAFFILDSFLWWGKTYFNIANALAFVLLLLALYWHACGRVTRRIEPGIWLTLAGMAWLALPHFGEVAVWMCGSTVYLWTAVWMVYFLLPYHLHLRRPFAGRGYRLILPMCMLGVLAGWGLENASLTTGLLAIGATLLSRRRHTAQPWQWAGIAGGILGFLALVAAPGNFVRIDGVTHTLARRLGNQIAGNAEMLLYILPLLLLAVIAYRLLAVARVGRDDVTSRRSRIGLGLTLAVSLLLAHSYLTTGYLGAGLRDILFYHVLTPLELATPKLYPRVGNLTGGLEEYGLYAAVLAFIYHDMLRRLRLTKAETRSARRAVTWCRLWREEPDVRFATVLIGMSFVNNLIMLGAPTFPARATFFSVLLWLTALTVLIRMPAVRTAPAALRRHRYRLAALTMVPFIAATVYFTYRIHESDAARIAYIEAQTAQGVTAIAVDPIPFPQRMLRHIFYIDWDNGVSAGGLKAYYGLTELSLTSPPVR